MRMKAPTFSEILAQDIQNCLMNTSEFAEYRTVIYQDLRYEKIPVCIQDFEENQRERVSVSGIGHAGTDSTPGLYRVSKVFYCALSNLGGVIPEKDTYLKISSPENQNLFQTFRIVVSRCEMGLICLELQEVRQRGWC